MYRKYLYVLATWEQPSSPASGRSEGPGPAPGRRLCDCVEVYRQSSGQQVFKMTFHFALKFRQIVLVGQETERSLLLLTGENEERAWEPGGGEPRCSRGCPSQSAAGGRSAAVPQAPSPFGCERN